MEREKERTLLELMHKNVIPVIGCTEPIAIAYSAAKARSQVSGEIQSIDVWLDLQMFRNGMHVAIPGVNGRGLALAAALGAIAGKHEKGTEVIEDLSESSIAQAKALLERQAVNVHLRENCSCLYIETRIETDKDWVQVITVDKHLNVVVVNKNKDEIAGVPDCPSRESNIQQFGLSDFIDFAENVSLSELALLKKGLEMNRLMANEGFKIKDSVCNSLSRTVDDQYTEDDMFSFAQKLTAAASEARMSGSQLPVMTCAGSGNHGITVFLILEAARETMNIPDEKILRALALANLITIYIKSYTGTLSAMCGCGVAAGIGASAALVYLMGGNTEQIVGAIKNMVGSISGIVCDGAKEGCAFKLALSAGWAVQAAFLSLRGAVVCDKNGIITGDFENIIKNLGHVCNPGMLSTNQAILDIMTAI